VFDVAASTVVVEFNDLAALESALAPGDIACVLAEPVMTNAGMVLPAPGYLAALRDACTRHGTLLVIDETHTLSSGRGGYARTTGLAADLLVCGKAVAGGLPCAVYGFTDEVAQRMREAEAARESGHSGLGTTLSANPLALAALAASLTQLMTAANHDHMNRRAAQLAGGIEAAFAARALAWQVSRVGARLEFGRGRPPRNGTESLAALDHDLEAAMHLYLLNRGFLLTPFHNMMLMSPATTPQQVDRFLACFAGCLDEFEPLLGTA
jgi:glutamate-1-semialdehyde 2,1-aminomutase